MSAGRRPISLTLAALGGQGGGVVAEWLIATARREAWLVQATSVPGVAQRTGATIYYLELFPETSLPPDGRRPVMALMPCAGDVDIVVASEWVEAGRVMQRGFVTPERTTLIASTHRVYTISEKSAADDGRADGEAILTEATQRARRLVAYDMAALAEQHGAVISAVILGAIAGAAGLPFAAESYRAAIRAGGIAVDTNLAAFEASLLRAQAGGVAPITARPTRPSTAPDAAPDPLHQRLAEFPAAARTTIEHGVARLIDYQDAAYAAAYLDRLDAVMRLEPADTGTPLTESIARGLALWMTFEDTIRVAQLKTRPGRTEAIAARHRKLPDEIVHVTEFLKPRVEEICGSLPAALGRRLLGSSWWRRRLDRLTGGRQLRSTTVSGYALLRAIAGLRRWRRGTLRYADEHARIDAWLTAVARHAKIDYALALEIAQCQSLVRGYGETFERGLMNFNRIVTIADRLAGRPDAAPTVARLRRAAAADDHGAALGRELEVLAAA